MIEHTKLELLSQRIFGIALGYEDLNDHDDLRADALLATLVGARRALEVGTFTGYSALCVAEALPEDGKLITCDNNEDHVKAARSFFDRSPHGQKIEIAVGDALATVKALPAEPFDFAFLDADKARYPEYYDEIVVRLRLRRLKNEV